MFSLEILPLLLLLDSDTDQYSNCGFGARTKNECGKGPTSLKTTLLTIFFIIVPVPSTVKDLDPSLGSVFRKAPYAYEANRNPQQLFPSNIFCIEGCSGVRVQHGRRIPQGDCPPWH